MNFGELVKMIFQRFPKLPIPYVLTTVALVGGGMLLNQPKAREILYGPEWENTYDTVSEKECFETDLKLRNCAMTVRTQLEVKYDDVVFYILEVWGMYDVNYAELRDMGTGEADATQGTKVYLELKLEQREKLDTEKERLKNLLAERLKVNYGDDFKGRKFELTERQVAEVTYQTLNSNNSETMYVSFTGGETRRILKSEVILRNPDASVGLDEMGADGSIYTNGRIQEIVQDCMQKYMQLF